LAFKNILVAGGYTEDAGVTDECEIFCPKSSKWIPTSPMTEKKSALALVTIAGLPNRKQYLPHWQFKK